MKPEEPGPDVTDLWPAYLDYYRETIIAGVLPLSPQAQRTARVPSDWTPIELLSHVLHMEQRWFVWGFLGEDVPDPWGDWNVDTDPWESGEGRWFVPPEVTAEALAGRLRAVGERTRGVLAGHRRDERAALGGRFSEDPPTLEWICFHVLQEYARHAGHLDVVVELGG